MLTLSMITFIFVNSSFDANVSSQHSLGVREWINSIFSSLNIDIVLTDHVVRKCAHFAEYFVLGTLLFFTARAYLKKLLTVTLVSVLTGLLVAVIDEIIQLFSKGRSCQFSDVMLDLSAVICASIILFLIYKLVNKRSKRDKGKENE
ncbi:MAG: VanZ family protein [Eubacteriales bacterium]|nr:VanZ family protein [Eubacteriales bacterium]